MSQRDYYDVLGVSRTATADEIKKAHRKLVRQYHPDKNKAKDAAKKFAEVQEAYDVLSDPEKKAQYDRFGAVPGSGFGGSAAGAGNPWSGVGAGPGGGSTFRWSSTGGGPGGFDFSGGGAGGPDISSVFEELFGGGGGGGGGAGSRRRRGRGGGFGGSGSGGGAAASQRGADIQHQLDISFETAMKGGKEQIRLSSSGGQSQMIDVTIPKGIAQGAKLRLRGKGQPGPAGAGDLILTIHVGNHPWYRRDGLDLYMDVPLTMAEAVLGVTVDVPTPKGSTVSLKIPPGTSSGQKLRIPGHGIEHAKGEKGDFYAVVAIHTDKNPAPEVKETFEGLKDKLENPRKGGPWK